MSGGGARGIAQIGVLQVLEENNIPIDHIVGVSMGAIIGGLYAAGYSSHDMEIIVKDLNWNDIIKDTPPRKNLFIGQKEDRDRPIFQIRLQGLKPVIPQSITAGQRLSSILTDLTRRAGYQPIYHFDDLKVPFRALACDLVSGSKVLIEDGDLAEAMRASATFPLLFSPVVRNNMQLVDGGLINNIPVEEVKESGVDIVIALDTTSKLHEKKQLTAPWVIADQVTSIMQREKLRDQREKADVLIPLGMEHRKSDNFMEIDELIQQGRIIALSKIDSIEDLLQYDLPDTAFTIENVRIHNCSRSTRPLIETKTDSLTRDVMSYRDVYEMLEEIYRLDIFEDVNATIDRSSVLHISVKENPSFQSVDIVGNTVIPDSVILSAMKIIYGDPIHYNQSREDVDNIIDIYRERGYSLMHVQDIQLRNDTLTIKINEGVISNVVLQGNERTRNYVILRDFPLKRGDIFNLQQANEGIQNIHSSGFFTNVSFEIQETNNAYDVIIKLLEKPFSLLRMSARYDSERKGSVFLEIADENILGSGNNLSLHGRYGLRDRVAKLQFRSDRIFQTYLSFQMDMFHRNIKYYTYLDGQRIGNYSNISSGISASFGRQIQRLGNLSFIARLISTELKETSGYGYPTEKFELKTLAVQSIIDTQNKFPFPTDGKYYKFFYEVSSASFFNSQQSFFKLYSSLESYFSFLRRNTIHPKISWGISDLTTPYSEQFRMGGLTSFYGLHDSENIGRYLFSSSVEYRYFFPFGFAFDVFWSLRYDVGATWRNAADINPQDIQHAIGTALSIASFLGPLTLAYGRTANDRELFYLSAGYEF